MLSYKGFNFKACFFDLDDTLIDAMSCHVKANVATFSKYGLDSNQILARASVNGWEPLGRRLSDIYQRLYNFSGLTKEQATVEQLLAERCVFFLENVKNEAHLLPGAKQALEHAKQAGCLTAITTSGNKAYMELVCEKYGLAKLVDFTLTAEDVAKGKPDPEIYQKAFSRAGKLQPLTQYECLVIEDSVNGVVAAGKAEIPVCFVPLFPYTGEVEYVMELKTLLEFPKTLTIKHN